jgi:hypothetical protein
MKNQYKIINENIKNILRNKEETKSFCRKNKKTLFNDKLDTCQ